MAIISCPSCAKKLNVSDQYAGKQVRCPGCQGVLTVPDAPPPEAPVEVVPVPSRSRSGPPPVPEVGEDDDRPRRRPRDDDDYDDRTRRRRPVRRGGEWAECPHCGVADATRIHWAWWGGFIGPALINVVRCNECGTNYNGVHGDYNGTRILIYTLVSIFLGLLIAGVAIAVGVIANQ